MSSEKTEDHIIINDNFRTKQYNLANMSDIIKGSQKSYNLEGKEVLSIDLDDPRYLNLEPNNYLTFGHYDYNDAVKPEDQLNGLEWTLYRTGNNLASNTVLTVGETPDGLLLEHEPSITIVDGTSVGVVYYYRPLSDEDQVLIKSTGIGVCEFRIAIPPYTFYRNPPLWGDITSDGLDGEFWKQTVGTTVQNFICFGAYDANNDAKKFRFTLIFRNYYDSETDTWSVWAFENIAHGKDLGIMIPNWDGQSFRTFKMRYEPNLNDEIKGTLYIKDENAGIFDEEWIPIKTDMSPAETKATYWNAPEFGSYSTPGFATMSINYYDFKAYVRDEYDFIFDGTRYELSSAFIEFAQEEYSFDVKGSGTLEVDWFFNNKQNTVNITEEDDSKIEFDTSWFSTANLNNYYFFQKKHKTIRAIGDKGTIRTISAPNKNIYNINLVDLSNLEELNLANNKLHSLDVSHNSKLVSVDVSNNEEFDSLLLPFGSNPQLRTVNFENTKVPRFKLYNPDDARTDVTVTISDCIESFEVIGYNLSLTNPELLKNTLRSLSLQNTKIDDPERFAAISWSLLKDVDISESNILTNRSNLETFLNNLPDRSSEDECGTVYMYGKKYTKDGVQGSSKAIADTLEKLRLKNWLFYL
jgi:hypothetical protein